MNFDDLGRVWREEGSGDFLRTRIDSLGSVRDRAEEMDVKVRRRDLRETFLGVGVVVFIGVQFATNPEVWSAFSPISKLGLTIVAIGVVVSTIRRRMAGRSVPDVDLPIGLALQADVDRLRAQERFLGNMFFWHVGPLGTGCILAVGGASMLAIRVRVIYALAVIALSVFSVSWHGYNARRKFRPIRLELEGWLADLEESDLDQEL